MDTVKEISVQDLDQRRKSGSDFFLLDVREPSEYDQANLQGYLIPLGELSQRYHEIPTDKTIIVHCRSGGRSRRAAEFLMEQGYHDIYNLAGGITAWSQEIDPS